MADTMTKSELSDELCERLRSESGETKYPLRLCLAATRIITDRLVEVLGQGNPVEIRGFGRFAHRYRRARHTRNPIGGAFIDLDERVTVCFRPGKKLRERVDDGKE